MGIRSNLGNSGVFGGLWGAGQGWAHFLKALFQLHQDGALAPRNQPFPVAAVAGSKANLARLVTDDGAFARWIGGFYFFFKQKTAYDILVVIMHGGGLIWPPAIDPNRDAPV